MRIGAVFPQTEIGADPAGVREWVRAVEDMGYKHILVYDHVLGAGIANRPGWSGPYTSETMFHEPMVLFGYLAGITQTVELVTGVLILPQRQTALVAKQAAEVDVLSGGRLRLGIGVGWNKVEYDGLNENFGDRGVRSEEQIALLRALWREPVASFQGRWHTIDEAGINPLPTRRSIPIWIGGHDERTLRRTARLADGWFPLRAPDDETRSMIERLRGYTVEAGRALEDIGVEAWLNVSRTPEHEWQEHVEGWRTLGATHLCVNTMGAGLTSPQQHIDMLQRAIATIER